MVSATRMRICPCGNRLERRESESLAVFAKRRYCGIACRGRYFKQQQAQSNFGNQTPGDKNRVRVGPGMSAYLGSYRSRQW